MRLAAATVTACTRSRAIVCLASAGFWTLAVGPLASFGFLGGFVMGVLGVGLLAGLWILAAFGPLGNFNGYGRSKLGGPVA